MSFVLALALSVFVQVSASSVEIDQVFNVTVRGQDYQLVELLHVKRDQINPANILRGKRGAKYWEYRVFDNEYPVRFYEPDASEVIKQTKGIPDNRLWLEKHPNVQPTIQILDMGFTIANWFF